MNKITHFLSLIIVAILLISFKLIIPKERTTKELSKVFKRECRRIKTL